jgi:DNA-binding response OmpR family regulator
MKILLVEDEAKTATYLSRGLIEQGFVADVCGGGEDGLHHALTTGYAAIILDIMLPQLDGWTVLAELRRAGRDTPVLILTARDAVPDRVRGLDLGADDYLVKPFAFSEPPACGRCCGGRRRGAPRSSRSPTSRSTFDGTPSRGPGRRSISRPRSSCCSRFWSSAKARSSVRTGCGGRI